MEFVGLDKMTLLDYPERVACIIFVKPCNYRCPFCHNGESVIGSVDEIPFQTILDFLKTRIGLLDGVVVSGGEPTLMPDLKEKLIKIKELGYNIKMDSNGTNPEVLKDLIENKLVDYIAMDIKNSEELYTTTTNTVNPFLEKVKQSINILKNSGIDYEFRTTLVQEFHNEKSIEGIGKLALGAKQIYLQKFVERDGCFEKGLHEVDEETAKKYLQILSKFVKKASLRGY